MNNPFEENSNDTQNIHQAAKEGSDPNDSLGRRIRDAYEEPYEIAKIFGWMFLGHLLAALAQVGVLLKLPFLYFPFTVLLEFPLCLLFERFDFLDPVLAFAIWASLNGTRWGTVAVISKVAFKRWWLLPLINILLNVPVAIVSMLGPLKT